MHHRASRDRPGEWKVDSACRGRAPQPKAGVPRARACRALATARLQERDKPWHEERLPLVEERVRGRLNQLSTRLGDPDWLDGAFSAGDLMMVSVLLRLKSSGIVAEYQNLAAYVARGEARPAYKRAFDAQLAVNTGKTQTG